MRHRKPPPPSPTATPSPPSTEPNELEYDLEKTLAAIERILGASLPVETSVTPAQLADIAEMFLTLMHLRKVNIDYWMKVSPAALRMFTLSQRIQAEHNLRAVEGMSEKAISVIDGALQLSFREINGLRRQLVEHLNLLRQMSPPGAKVH
jgi:hypothetical protein